MSHHAIDMCMKNTHKLYMTNYLQYAPYNYTTSIFPQIIQLDKWKYYLKVRPQHYWTLLQPTDNIGRNNIQHKESNSSVSDC